MGKFKDVKGQRFGRLVAVEYINGDSMCRSGRWKCVCDCGNEKIVRVNKLLSGNTKSCGCYRREYTGDTHRTHGLTNSKLDSIYYNMLFRCNNKNSDHYKYYGERGIKVCDEWQNKENGKMNFFNWAFTNGYVDGLSIERIDVNGDYCPDNCTWIPLEKQRENKRPIQYKYGYPGIFRRKDNGKYSAYLKVNGTQMVIGSFNTAEEAYSAYKQAKETGFVDFAKNKRKCDNA